MKDMQSFVVKQGLQAVGNAMIKNALAGNKVQGASKKKKCPIKMKNLNFISYLHLDRIDLIQLI